MKNRNETLILVVNKAAFELINSGKKRVEYRDIKEYWFRRLLHPGKAALIEPWTERLKDKTTAARWNFDNYQYFHKYKKIEFRLGYAKSAPRIVFDFLGVTIGLPIKELTAGLFSCENEVFKIHFTSPSDGALTTEP